MDRLMTVEYEQDRLAALKQVQDQLRPVLGESVASRLKMFKNGTLYVEAPLSATFMAWLIDSVLVNGTAIGLGALYFVSSSVPNKDAGAVVIAFTLIFVLPLLYGWFYGDGRGVGALLAGTRLVRMKDGSRVGLRKAGWAMLIRTLLLPLTLLAALSGSSGGHEDIRVSIDVHANDQLVRL